MLAHIEKSEKMCIFNDLQNNPVSEGLLQDSSLYILSPG